ncbi:MAG: SBBP repeat-containing protein [bacterium]
MVGSARLVFTGLLVTFITVSVGLAGSDNLTTSATVMKGLASMPLAFTENQGQWDEKVLFRANAGGATMWFSRDGAYYQFTRHIPTSNYSSVIASDRRERGNLLRSAEVTQPGEPVSGVEGSRGRQMSTSAPFTDHQPDSIETIMIKANFVGVNPNPRMVGEDMLEYKCNYFLGNDPAKWRTNVPNYSAIVYEEIYPGIHLKYYGNGKQMEYDFIVSPGVDFSQIRIQYEGAKSLSIDAAGRLVVQTEWGEVIEQRPVVYQMSGSDRVALVGEFVLKGDKAFGFELSDGYDTNLPLVIDPVLIYSTYLGGSNDEYGYDIAVDASGATYITGDTYSTDFPTVNPYQTDQGYCDVFVTKLSNSGNSLVYSTYLGGSINDWGFSIAVDATGAVYITGDTYSTDFPTVNPYQTYQDKTDVIVTKLSSDGSSIVYSTYLGGNNYESGHGIAVDSSGAAYVTGATASPDFPTENPYQTYQGGYDAFITKLSSGGNSLLYSTYLGGKLGGCGIDRGYHIAVDASGAAYVTGFTESTDFPTENPYQTYQGGNDAFVTKLSSSGSSLVYSTYLGGSVNDLGYGIAVDTYGAVYVTGSTESTDFQTENPYQTDQGGRDVFVTKLSSSGSSLVYSTYLGGNDYERGHGIAVDGSGAAYVTGHTYSKNFPTLNAYQSDQDTIDVFVTKLTTEGSSLVYSTYLGGNNVDYGRGIAVDATGAAYVIGYTESTDFPTENPYQTDQGGLDAFVTKFFEYCCNHDGIRGDADYSMTLDVGDLTFLVAYLFQGGPPPPCLEEGDVDGSGAIDVGDLTWLVAFLFQSGPPPAPCP